MKPRCGKPIGKRKVCVRPERHRGVCSVRSADLEAAALEVHTSARGIVIDSINVGGREQLLPGDGVPVERYGTSSAEQDRARAFCELAVDVGLARTAELLKRIAEVVLS